jgi:hypothetical protein
MNGRWLARESDSDSAFPSVKSLTLTYTQHGDGVDDRRYPRSHGFNQGPSLRCDNPRCHAGGVDLTHFIREMVRTLATSQKLELGCNGFEGSPKGRRKVTTCFNHFSVTITIVYLEPNDSGDQSQDA